MKTRPVLTVNQVYDIICKYTECGDWLKAFVSTLPKRKGALQLDDNNDNEDEDKDKDNKVNPTNHTNDHSADQSHSTSTPPPATLLTEHTEQVATTNTITAEGNQDHRHEKETSIT